jgi:hypothetical protein
MYNKTWETCLQCHLLNLLKVAAGKTASPSFTVAETGRRHIMATRGTYVLLQKHRVLRYHANRSVEEHK